MQVNNNTQLDQSAYVNANKALNRISTGLAINSASDNSSALSIVQNLNAQASGLSQSIENVNNGLASLQIADSAINEQSEILNQVKEKLLQSSTDTTSQEGRENILKDIKSLLENFDNIASSTKYNDQNLLQKNINEQEPSKELQFQAGEKSEDIIESSAIQSNTQGTNLSTLLNQNSSNFTAQSARDYLENIDEAISTINDFRSELGANQNQLQSSSRNLLSQYTQTNISSSSIQDVDYAKEVSNFSKQNILAQIGSYSGVQANNINQNNVSKLLS